ncbi:MAG TPA: FG-GAP-like repeat-containing protein [Pseudomonadota bacterium]|nr:FG-GAP-like repeat-containing protein [Pseudomonadota bacterium]
MRRMVPLLVALALAGCHPDTAFIEVFLPNVPKGAAKLLLSVRLFYEIAAPISPLLFPVGELQTATLGLRLPTTAGYDGQSLVVGVGVVDETDCPLSIGLGQTLYRNVDSRLTVELVPAPPTKRLPCSLLQPLIFGVTPARGPSSGHTLLSIHGWAFDEQAAVTVGGLPATAPDWKSSNQLTAFSPEALGIYGPVPVQLTNRDNSSFESRSLFSYYASQIRLAGHRAVSQTTPGSFLFALGAVATAGAGNDLVRVNAQNGRAEVFADLPTRNPVLPGEPLNLQVAPSAIALIANNPAGRSDLVFTTSGDGGIVLFPNQQRSPAFTSQQVSRTFVGLAPSAAASVQLVSGRSPDLVITDRAFDEVNVLYRQPDGTFSRKARTSYSVDREPVAVLAADVTGDGRTDLIIGHRNRGAVTALVQPAAIPGSPLEGTSIQLQSPYDTLSAGDIDGDGRAELVYTETSAGQSTIHVAYLKAGRSRPELIADDQPVLAGLPPITSLLVLDLNGDGRAEIIAATATPELLVYARDDSGVFSPVSGIAAPEHPITVLSALPSSADRLTDFWGADSVSGTVTYWKNTSL